MLIDPCELSPSYVRSIAPYQPGKPISELAREMGLDEKNIVKLASNENPRGIGPRTRAAIDAALADIARYPDGNGFELKAALADMEFVARSFAENLQGLRQLEEGAQRLGLEYIPSHGNFLTIRVAQGGKSAAEIYRRLLPPRLL